MGRYDPLSYTTNQKAETISTNNNNLNQTTMKTIHVLLLNQAAESCAVVLQGIRKNTHTTTVERLTLDFKINNLL